MVTARNDFEEFLLQQGFPPDRANYWASALERANEAVTIDVLNSTLEIALERQANYVLTVMRDEFAKRDEDIASIHRDVADIRQEIALLSQAVNHLAAMRREDREREQADRRERRAFTFGMTGVVLGLTGAVIAALLRLFGAI